MSREGETALTPPEGLLSRETIARKCQDLRDAGRRIVFTNGCFDLLHVGHVVYLEEARRLGDMLAVGLNSDASVTRLKGEGRPWNSEVARARVLLGLSSVDFVTVFGEDTPLELIRAVRPHVLCKGGDYEPEQVVGRTEVESDGGRVVILPFVAGFSSTRLYQQIRAAGG